jgi:antitoxin MazE
MHFLVRRKRRPGMLTRVQAWGNNQGARVPLGLLETGIAVGDEVDITVQVGRLVVAPSHRIRGKNHLEDLLAQLPADYEPAEEDWGPPVGREEW